MSRPSVSWSCRYVSTFAMTCASCARFLSSQKTAGAPVARARRHRELDPVADRRCPSSGTCGRCRPARPSARAASRRSRPRRRGSCRSPGAMKVLSCEPYSSAFCAMRPTFGTLPIVAGLSAPCLLAVLDDLPVHRRVAAVGDHRLRVVELPVRAPHLARLADDDRHGRVDDDVVRDVQVRDALVRVDHRERRARRVDGLDVGLDLRLLLRRQRLDLRVEVAEAVVRVHAELLERGGVLLEDVLVEDGHGVAEHDGVGDLHHGGLEVQREQDAVASSRPRSAPRRTCAARGRSSPSVSMISPSSSGAFFLRTVIGAVGGDELDPVVGRLLDRDGVLAAVEVARRSCARRGPSTPGSRRRACAGSSSRTPSPTSGERRSELPSRSTGFTALPEDLARSAPGWPSRRRPSGASG